MSTYLKEEIGSIIDVLLEAHERKISREFDAAACRTSYDYERARDAESDFWDAREKAVIDLRNLSK